jgi:phosphoserine aminotransferase
MICHMADLNAEHSAGIRASLYNAVTEEETDQLVTYIQEFISQSIGI